MHAAPLLSWFPALDFACMKAVSVTRTSPECLITSLQILSKASSRGARVQKCQK